MPQIYEIALESVQRALVRYEDEVEESPLSRQSKDTYIRHARQFVKWLADDFVPGGTLNQGARW